MGLPVRVVLYAASDRHARDAAGAAFQRIAALDRMMSDYRPDSELRRLERARGRWMSVSAELFATIERAVAVAQATDGAFDPTIGPVVSLWREARKSGRLPETTAIETARALVDWRRIELNADRRAILVRGPEVRFDLGGIAKGYILQAALHTLRGHGVASALIEAGGDIVVGDPPPGRDGWHIETDGADPAFRERASSLRNAALATSGPTAQFVEIAGVRYSHVVDPRTGLGITNPLVARVIAADAATADALATALTVAGKDRAPELCARFPGAIASLTRAR